VLEGKKQPGEIFEEINKEQIECTLEMCKTILVERGCDYGRDNFIIAAKIANIVGGYDEQRILPHDVANCLFGIKLARIGNLSQDKIRATPRGELVKDSVRDAVNYLLLSERERERERIRSLDSVGKAIKEK